MSENEEFVDLLDNESEEWDDKILDDGRGYAIVKQKSNTLAWKIEGLTNVDGSIKPSHKLKSDPPILVLESSNGDAVQFVLTKELSRSLRDAMDMTYNGFYGVDKTFKPGVNYDENLTSSEKLMKFVEKNVLKLSVTAIAVVTVGVIWLTSVI